MVTNFGSRVRGAIVPGTRDVERRHFMPAILNEPRNVIATESAWSDVRVYSAGSVAHQSSHVTAADPSELSMKIAVIDDDRSARRAMVRLVRSAKMRVESFTSAREFLKDPANGEVDCVVSDVRMPGVDGFMLQKTLVESHPYLSLILVTGYGDVPMAVKAMKDGAVEFMEKPVDYEALLRAIRLASQRTRQLRLAGHELASVRERYETLTPRQREVFALVVVGLLNKQVGARLGISEKTVKVHRGRIMEQMCAQSLADLVRIAARLNICDVEYSSANGPLLNRPSCRSTVKSALSAM